MQGRKRAKARGQAAVELAVLMVVIVPVFLYVLFADELSRHKLDLQEAVVSSPWDYAFLNYESSVSSGALNAKHRNEHMNHSSINPGNKGRSNVADSQFTGPRWMKEVSCQLSKSDGLAPGSGIVADFKSKFQQGGKVTCTAQKGVVNFFLITKFMQQWSKLDLSTKAKSARNVGQTPPSSSTWPLAEQSFSIVTDTWALKNDDSVTPDYLPSSLKVSGSIGSLLGGGSVGLDACGLGGNTSGNPFYIRMFYIFCQGTGLSKAVEKANAIVKQANDDGYLQSHLVLDSLFNFGGVLSLGGDNTGTPTLGFVSSSTGAPDPSQSLGFNSSPWKGGGGDKYYQAHSQRKDGYMGEELKAYKP